MKPNFALKLSNDGIELLHRATAGWLSVGTVDFANDDVAQGCARLLDDAARLAPEGVRTKLVLPDSEVRYTSLVAPGPTDEARRYQIEAELEALTPYAIDELAYDWSIDQDYALVAICARETLAEAEGFAEGYGFNPVCFVAAAPNGEFNGEPFLGETMSARALMGAGETVQRDAEPVRVVGVASAPLSQTQSADEPEADKTAADSPAINKTLDTREEASASAIKPAPAADRDASASTPPRDSSADVTPPKPTPTPKAPVEPQAPAVTSKAAQKVKSVLPTLTRRAEKASPEAPQKTPQIAGAKPATAPDAGAPGSEAPDSEAQGTSAKMGDLVRRMGTRLRREKAVEKAAERAAESAGNKASEAPAAAAPLPPAAPKPVAPKTPVAPTAPGKADTPTKPDAAPAAVSFASRRQAVKPVVASTSSAPSGGQPAANPGGRIAVLPDASAAAASGQNADAANTPLHQQLLDKGRQTLRSVLERPGKRPSQKATPAPVDSAGDPKATLLNGAAPSAPEISLDRTRPRRSAGNVSEPIVPSSRPPVSEREKASEAEALTIFGARGHQTSGASFARRGMMIGGAALLMVLAAVIWALYFGADDAGPTQLAGDPTATAEQTPDTPTDTAVLAGSDAPITSPTALDAPAASDVAQPAPLDPAVSETAEAPAEASEPAASADEAPTTDPGELMERLVDEAITTPDPEAEVAAVDGAAADTAGPDGSAPTESSPTVATRTASVDQQGTEPAGAPQADAGQTTPAASDSPVLSQGAGGEAVAMSLPSGLEVPPSDEVAFSPPAPPPPFGTEFALNEQGLVEATPEGALTPSGVTVYAGRPAKVPAPRPAAISARAPQPVEPVVEVTTTSDVALAERLASEGAEVTYDDTPRANPDLADARPRPRSPRVEALAPTPSPEAAPPPQDGAVPDPQQDAAVVTPDSTQTADLQTPPPGGVSLSALRPQPRPSDLVPEAGVAEQTVADAEAGPETETGTEAESETEELEEAVARSLVPGARPANLAERAERILAARRAGQSDGVEDNAGETASRAVAGAQPSIPSSASVARQATERNAIRLSEYNLIGVFGTESRRRALVRSPGGRVRRVEVGDRLDGGRITAIGANELIYTKNGRNRRLEIGG